MRPLLLPILVFALALLLFWHASHAAGADQSLRILYLLSLLLLVTGFGFRWRRMTRQQAIKYAALWLVIIFGLVLFYGLMLKLRGPGI